MYLGVKVVIAKTLERIHTANLINFGIIPLQFKEEADYEKIEQGDELEFPDVRAKLKNNEKIIAKNLTKGIELEMDYDLSKRQREIILAGGLLNYTTKE